MKKLSVVTILSILLCLFVVGDSFGRKGGGGGFRSSSSSRSSFSSSKPKKTSSSGFSSKSSSSKSTSSYSSKPKANAVDAAKYQTAVKNGSAFKTRDAAVSDFKKKYANNYTSKYKTEPKIRPTHIPRETQVGGKNVTINYNQQYGGYGYMNPLGQFILYDMMSDSLMMSAMMSNHNYHVGPPPVVHTTYGLPIIFIAITVIALVGFIFFLHIR